MADSVLGDGAGASRVFVASFRPGKALARSVGLVDGRGRGREDSIAAITHSPTAFAEASSRCHYDSWGVGGRTKGTDEEGAH